MRQAFPKGISTKQERLDTWLIQTRRAKPGSSWARAGTRAAKQTTSVASRLRTLRALHAFAALLKAVTDQIEMGAEIELTGELLRLLKEAEDRGLGQPVQSLWISMSGSQN